MRLNNNADAIGQEFGFDPQERLLFANIRRDAVKIVTPIIAELDSQKLLLVRQQETASVLFAGVPKERVRFWAAPVARSAQYASRFLLTGGCKIERTRPGTGIRARNAGAHGCTRVSSR